MEPECNNPHWLDGHPAWDIELTNGEVHRGVTAREIRHALQALLALGDIGTYDSYVGSVVVQRDIDGYDKYHTRAKQCTPSTDA